MSKKEKKILRSFMMITQISITMLVPIFISGWLGTWLIYIYFWYTDHISVHVVVRNRGCVQKCIYINQVLL